MGLATLEEVPTAPHTRRRPVHRSTSRKSRWAALMASSGAPVGTLFETLVAVAGRRWTVEESLEAAKGVEGLDHHEVRHYHSWYRHITLAMLALAYLAVVRSRLPGAALKGGAFGGVGRTRRADPAHRARSPSASLPTGGAHPGGGGGGAALVALASLAPGPCDPQSLPPWQALGACGRNAASTSCRGRPHRCAPARGTAR